MFEIIIDTMFYAILLLPLVIIIFSGLIWLLAVVQLSSIRLANKFLLELLIRLCDFLLGVKDTREKK